jgi:hypothetical protein
MLSNLLMSVPRVVGAARAGRVPKRFVPQSWSSQVTRIVDDFTVMSRTEGSLSGSQLCNTTVLHLS